MILDFILNLFKKKEEVKMVEKKPEPVVVVEEPKKILSAEELLYINNGLYKIKCDEYIDALNKVLPENNIDTPLRICHFLAQIIHESGHLKYNSENLNYSASALKSVFKKYFPTDELANQYARQPEKIANRVYANRMGNGNEASGDGYRYRGRGLIQLTGKNNYTSCGNDLDIDLVNNPDLLLVPEYALKSAGWFWNKNKLNQYADNDDITTITKKINGGTNGLEDRTQNLKKAKAILLKKP